MWIWWIVFHIFLCLFVCICACHKYFWFSCGLDAAASVLNLCVCVSSSLQLCESRTPCIPGQVCLCVCLHMCLSLYVCVHKIEWNRQVSMGSMPLLQKTDYGTCRGVRNTPYQHYTNSQLSAHLYGCICRAPSLLLPSGDEIQVFPQQFYMSIFCRCFHCVSFTWLTFWNQYKNIKYCT